MTFENALKESKYHGSKIKRKIWKDKYIKFIKDGIVNENVNSSIYVFDGFMKYTYFPNYEDAFSDDWEVVNESI